MKILVCISRTPDTTAKIAFVDNNTKFAAEGPLMPKIIQAVKELD